MTDQSRRKIKLPSALAVLGWLVVSLSVLDLAKNFTPLELHGSIKEWSDAYSAFIQKIGTVAFGWLKWGWILIDENENHIIVIMSVLMVAVTRELYKRHKHDTISPDKVRVLIISIIAGFMAILLPTFVIILLLPGIFGLVLGMIFGIWQFLILKYNSALRNRSRYMER